MSELEQYLRDYVQSGYYPFHMPGHKRNSAKFNIDNPYEIDVTEVEGTDNLHHAKGILKHSMDKAAKCFHADKTYYLINGSSGGILAAISACVKRGDTVLMARNCHKSVYHACLVNDVKQRYLYPEFTPEGIALALCPELVKEAIETYRPACVVLTSPTYEGVVTSLKEIVEMAHQYQIPVIVDAAHGAHFGFNSYFPKSAMEEGADIVIQSAHKTLPSLTQTSLLHKNHAFMYTERLEFYLRLYQTTSPSYVLMSSLDQCVDYLLAEGEHDFDLYAQNLNKLRTKLSSLQHLYLFETSQYDPSKIVVSTKNTNLSGHELAKLLREQYRFESEMAERQYCILMTTVCDSEESLATLGEALLEIDASCEHQLNTGVSAYPATNAQLTAQEAFQAGSGVVAVSCARPGDVVSEYAYIYPPGMPLIVPGEVMTAQIYDLIHEYKAKGFTIEK